MIRLLLIDHHPVVRDGLTCSAKQSSDFVVVGEADNGYTGYQSYLDCNADVVIMEMSLPDIGGLEVARKILQRSPDARILIFSAHENEMLIQRARDIGVRGFVGKRRKVAEILAAARIVADGGSYFIDSPPVQSGKLGWGLQLLTPREFEVFRHLAEGRTVIAIAKLLNSSPKTVGVHQTRILKKLGVTNSAQLAHLALGGDVIGLQATLDNLQEGESEAPQQSSAS
ncbi:response regulator transcription factor [Methylococcus sp. EFPC2]|uniref:response regulator transcription factor n=1 Tax=Methylococcus sp. EFPC2 TaxID=2812648 RepID=UPI001966F0A2|nr:response regulator transcription factor [Methylococcus sp. EFPC2]QSA95579.1 response regulator transcription factor [Methylococcus sp. EFPC2]